MEEAHRQFLYHGTGENFRHEEVKGGGYDQVLWTSESSDIAQNYIPEAGLRTCFHLRDDEMREVFAPHQGFNECVLHMMDAKYEANHDFRGQATSWIWRGDRVTHKDVANFLGTLGYERDDRHMFEIKFRYDGHQQVLLPADYKAPGHLFVIEGKERLNLFDYAKDREGDAMDPDYHKRTMFRQKAFAGYDGIVINDFAQSEVWGNVGHQSVGLFPKGIEQVNFYTVPCTTFDWPETGLALRPTPEFTKLCAENGVLPRAQQAKSLSLPSPEATYEQASSLVATR